MKGKAFILKEMLQNFLGGGGGGGRIFEIRSTDVGEEQLFL